MDFIDFTLLSFLDGSSLLNILIAAAGLGMVIFFHELGHFLVAKWCDVNVERFSIGFGQPILARKWGETEYWLSWIPFGGYVKMLGQDDMDPGQMTDDEVAEDPRSYSAKSVPQRMAIISAGVIMNIITGFIFFVIAFSSGVETTDRVVGNVEVGMPGWTNGLRMGDTITSINGRVVENFEDILRGTALSRGAIRLKGFHDDNSEFDITLTPAKEGIVRQIGLRPNNSTTVHTFAKPEEFSIKLPGTATADVDFQPGDTIESVNGTAVEDYTQLVNVLHENAAETLDVGVRRKGSSSETVHLKVPPQHFVGFGMRMWIGKVEAVRKDSPAEKAGLKVGDQIAKIIEDGVEAGSAGGGEDALETAHDPFRLTEYFSKRAGKEVTVVVSREVKGGSPEEVELKIVPESRPAWSEPPLSPASLLSIPSIGVGYNLMHSVYSVDEGSVAAEHGIQKRDQLLKITLKQKEGAKPDRIGEKSYAIEIRENNVAYAFWLIQEFGRSRSVEFEIKRADAEKPVIVQMDPQPIEGWYMPTVRGLVLTSEMTTQSADTLQGAIGMAGRYTVTSMEDIYLTLRGLIMGSISHKGLSGPLRIAGMAFGFADLGIGHFLRFLGLISINLAVINFLPIPVLDGGHMVFLIWEGILRRKPPERVVNFAHLVGFVLILSMMGFVMYQDVVSMWIS
ncbi:RIP metalloprotease RseP [Thalassoglobus sp.]|uniref:RIP metalloprotease RseP n=1 Tax=Thalassoglobus sp. TaxID=2795869 RepID=UPI003AA81BAB